MAILHVPIVDVCIEYVAGLCDLYLMSDATAGRNSSYMHYGQERSLVVIAWVVIRAVWNVRGHTVVVH